MVIRQFDPSDFDEDILVVQVRGLGRGRGFEVVDRYSILEGGSHPELLDLISDRVAIIYDMLYEGVEPDEDINEFDEDLTD